jgi:hypothetical protein
VKSASQYLAISTVALLLVVTIPTIGSSSYEVAIEEHDLATPRALAHTFEITECFSSLDTDDIRSGRPPAIVCATPEELLNINYNRGFRGLYKGHKVYIHTQGGWYDSYKDTAKKIAQDPRFPGSKFEPIDPRLVVQETKLNLTFKGSATSQPSSQVVHTPSTSPKSQVASLSQPSRQQGAQGVSQMSRQPQSQAQGGQQGQSQQQQAALAPPEPKDKKYKKNKKEKSRVANACIVLRDSHGPGTSPGGKELYNRCNETLRVSWCFDNHNPKSIWNCARDGGGADTVGAGGNTWLAGYQTDGGGTIRYIACTNSGLPKKGWKHPVSIPVCQ